MWRFYHQAVNARPRFGETGPVISQHLTTAATPRHPTPNGPALILQKKRKENGGHFFLQEVTLKMRVVVMEGGGEGGGGGKEGK